MLKEMFPIEAGEINPESRIIPHLPGEAGPGASRCPHLPGPSHLPPPPGVPHLPGPSHLPSPPGVPTAPAPRWFDGQRAAENRQGTLSEYCAALMALPPKISRGPHVLGFFKVRPDDLQLPGDNP